MARKRVIHNPYNGINWGNVNHFVAQYHTHTTHEPTTGHSGSEDPHETIDYYHDPNAHGFDIEERDGVDILELSEHSYNLSPRTITWPWSELSEKEGSYEDRDTDELGMLDVPGTELSDSGFTGHHIVTFYNDNTSSSYNIGGITEDVENEGGLLYYAHPGRYGAANDNNNDYVDLFNNNSAAIGIAVFNNTDRDADNSVPTDEKLSTAYPEDQERFDILLEELAPYRPIVGFADDDFHAIGGGTALNRGRNYVIMEELNHEEHIEALKKGKMYMVYTYYPPATIPEINSFSINGENKEIVVDATAYDGVQWVSNGSVISTTDSVDWTDESVGEYVRCRLYTGPESDPDIDVFSQAFYLEELNEYVKTETETNSDNSKTALKIDGGAVNTKTDVMELGIEATIEV